MFQNNFAEGEGPTSSARFTPITLDGTYTSVNDIAWTVELSDRTDIFVGRDSVADSASSTGICQVLDNHCNSR